MTESRGQEEMVRLEKWELGGLAKEKSESREGCEDRLLAHPEHKSADAQVHSTRITHLSMFWSRMT